MGIVIRQSFKSVIITIAGIILGVLINLLSVRYFDKAEFGFTQNIIKVAVQFSLISLFGINFTLLIYGQKYPPGHPYRGTFLTITAIAPLTISIIVALLYFLFRPYIISFYNTGSDSEMMHKYFVLFPILTIFTTAITWLESYLMSINKTAIQNLAREVLARIIYITLIVLFALGYINFTTFIWLYTFCYLLPMGYLLYMALRFKGFHFEYRKGTFSKKDISKILRYSFYQSMMTFSSVLLLQIDSLLLGPLDADGFEAIAVYGIAVFSVSILRNPLKQIGLASLPTLTQSYNNIKLKALKSQYLRAATTMQLAALYIALLMVLNIQNITDILVYIRPGYEAVKYLIPILLLGQVTDIFTGLNMEIISLSKYYKFNFWLSIFMLAVIIVLNYFLIKSIGIYGAAWATSISLIIFAIVKAFYINKKFKIWAFQKKTLHVLTIGAVSFLIFWWIPEVYNSFVDIILRSICFSIVFLGLAYRYQISPELNEIVKNIITKRKLF